MNPARVKRFTVRTQLIALALVAFALPAGIAVAGTRDHHQNAGGNGKDAAASTTTSTTIGATTTSSPTTTVPPTTTTAAPTTTTSAPTTTTTVAVPGSASVVTVCGVSLCMDGRQFYPYGASFYGSTPQAGILSNPGGAIALAITQHLNTVRTNNWLSHDANISDATSNVVWVPVDQFVADARGAGLKTFLDLSDFKTVLMKHCLNPYTDFSDWDTYINYAAHRVNTITGATYGSDQEIAFVQFAGEPREAGYSSNGVWYDGKYYTYAGAGTHAGDPSDPSPESNWGTAATGAGSCSSPFMYTTEQLNAFYAHVEADWKGAGATVLTIAGGLTKLDESHNGGIDYQTIFSNPDNDLCGFKTYGGMEAWLATGVSYCRSIGKPSINVEWGYQQALTDSARASDFQGQFANNNSSGIAGNFYWNAGYLNAASTYDVDNGAIAPQTFQVIVNNAP